MEIVYKWIEDDCLYDVYRVFDDGWVLSYLNRKYDLYDKFLMMDYIDSNLLRKIVKDFYDFIKNNSKLNYEAGFDVSKERLILFTYNYNGKRLDYNEIVFFKNRIKQNRSE